MLPLRDMNPPRTTPVVTWILIAICASVFVYEMMLPADQLELFFKDWALTPQRISDGDPSAYVTVLTSMFLHGGIVHALGNLWFLRLFGDNVEDGVGRARYVLLYLVCGVAAAGAQYFANPDSAVPMLGASGAIGGVLGAYLVLYPHARVQALMPGLLFGIVEVPALVYLLLWLGLQVLGGFSSIGREGGGVAYWAHLGGFAAGVVMGLLFKPSAHGVPQDHHVWPPDPHNPFDPRWRSR